jgi:hypothetical protein
MNDQDEGQEQLLSFRVKLLETQYANILKLVQETHDAVTTMKAKMGDSPFQCNVHAERMNSLDKRLTALEKAEETSGEEKEEQKKFIYKLTGGLAVVILIVSSVIAPLVVSWIKAKPSDEQPHQHTLVVPGSSNTFQIK